MNSFEFFNNDDFNKRWKNKSGIYILENPLFTVYTKYPVYKIGFAKDSLYTRISNYKTAYGLVPFKIHLLYEVPQGIRNMRPNYANLTERVLQETATRYGLWAGIGEWFKELPLLMNIASTVRDYHLAKHLQAVKWDYWVGDKYYDSLKEIVLAPEDEIRGKYKDLLVGKYNTRNSNIEGDDGSDLFEEFNRKNVVNRMPKKYNDFVMPKKLK